MTRARDPGNRRAHLVALTDDGRGAFQALLGTVVGFDERLRAGFSEDELATLRGLLHRLAANAPPPFEQESERLKEATR